MVSPRRNLQDESQEGRSCCCYDIFASVARNASSLTLLVLDTNLMQMGALACVSATTDDSRIPSPSPQMSLAAAAVENACALSGSARLHREHAKKFREEDMLIRLDGKNCLVTGANSGIGFATAESLASHGATVYMLCRNKDRGEVALNQTRSKTGNENVHLEICDLSSINEVKSFTTKFTSMDKPLHILVNNAGLLEHKREITAEGLELNFAVNVAVTYTLTELVMPLLEKAAPDARVITVASGGMYTEPLNKDLQFSEENFDGTRQYARNKRVQVALTEWWAEKYNDKGVGFYSMHPGWADTPGVAKSLPGLSEKLPGNLRSNEEGADTVVWLALQQKEKLSSGSFYFDRVEAPKHLKFAGTAASHSQINPIVDSIRSICGLPALQ